MFSKRTKPCEIAITGKVYTKMLSVGCALARIVSHVRSLLSRNKLHAPLLPILFSDAFERIAINILGSFVCFIEYLFKWPEIFPVKIRMSLQSPAYSRTKSYSDMGNHAPSL